MSVPQRKIRRPERAKSLGLRFTAQMLVSEILRELGLPELKRLSRNEKLLVLRAVGTDWKSELLKTLRARDEKYLRTEVKIHGLVSRRTNLEERIRDLEAALSRKHESR